MVWKDETSPANLSSGKDLGLVDPKLSNSGSIFRVVDFSPRRKGALHRTIPQDYIIIQKDSLVLILDNGTTVQLGQDDFVIQQATMHGWDNETDEWTRMLTIVLPAEVPVAN
jgi:hypothetical protein